MESYVYPIVCEKCHQTCFLSKQWPEWIDCISDICVRSALEYLADHCSSENESSIQSNTLSHQPSQVQERVAIVAWRVFVNLAQELSRSIFFETLEPTQGLHLMRIFIKRRWNLTSVANNTTTDFPSLLSYLLDNFQWNDHWGSRVLAQRLISHALQHSWNLSHWTELVSYSLTTAQTLVASHTLEFKNMQDMQECIVQSIDVTLRTLNQVTAVPQLQDVQFELIQAGIRQYLQLYFQQHSEQFSGPTSIQANSMRRKSQIFTVQDLSVAPEKQSCCVIQ